MAVLVQLIDGVVAQAFEISSTPLTLGRKKDNHVVIDDVSVSSSHATIEAVGNPDFPDYTEYFLNDLNSTNGTKINGLLVKGTQKLHQNDIVQIAWNTFKFVEKPDDDLAKTIHILNK